jgi:hypothetical protein
MNILPKKALFTKTWEFFFRINNYIWLDGILLDSNIHRPGEMDYVFHWAGRGAKFAENLYKPQTHADHRRQQLNATALS